MNQILNLINVFWKAIEAALKCCKSQLSDFLEPRSTEAIGILTKLRSSQTGLSYSEGFHVVRVVG
jgi:hypothetical protein